MQTYQRKRRAVIVVSFLAFTLKAYKDLFSHYTPPINMDAAVISDVSTFLEGINYNTSMSIEQPRFRPEKDDTIVEFNCAAKGAYPIMMHTGKGAANEWVCKELSEKKVTAVMLHVFKRHCRNDSPGLMLDVGANAGYYGLTALKMNCRTLFFDLQPGCHRFINNAIVVNQFTSRGRLIPYGVSASYASFKVPSGKCLGRYPQSAREQNTFDQGDAVAQVHPLTTFIGLNQPVSMVKVDTEGNELNVIWGSMHYFSNRLIKNVVMEITPLFWAGLNIPRTKVADAFEDIVSFGYTVVSLWDWKIFSSKEAVHYFVMEANFTQSDVWITLEDDVVESLGVVKLGLEQEG